MVEVLPANGRTRPRWAWFHLLVDCLTNLSQWDVSSRAWNILLCCLDPIVQEDLWKWNSSNKVSIGKGHQSSFRPWYERHSLPWKILSSLNTWYQISLFLGLSNVPQDGKLFPLIVWQLPLSFVWPLAADSAIVIVVVVDFTHSTCFFVVSNERISLCSEIEHKNSEMCFNNSWFDILLVLLLEAPQKPEHQLCSHHDKNSQLTPPWEEYPSSATSIIVSHINTCPIQSISTCNSISICITRAKRERERELAPSQPAMTPQKTFNLHQEMRSISLDAPSPLMIISKQVPRAVLLSSDLCW